MSRNGVNILLVEDNPQDAEMVIRALKTQNLAVHVKVARDGAEALEMLFAQDREGTSLLEGLKVILLDLKLPKVSGLEVLQRIKSDERTKSIPVVCLTSSTEDSDTKKCYELGANSYVVKPLEFEEFTQAVSQLGTYWVLLNQTKPG